jgi:hypothetical protein
MKKVYLLLTVFLSGLMLSLLACQSLHKSNSPTYSVTPLYQPKTSTTAGAETQLEPSPVQNNSEAPVAAASSVQAKSEESQVQPELIEEAAIRETIGEIQRVKACLTKIGTPQSCEFESEEPQDWPIEISRSLISELHTLLNLYSSNAYYSSKDPLSVESLARELLKYPDDNVQLAALKIAALFPPSTEMAVAVLKALDQSISVPLYIDGLQVLQKFVGTSAEGKVDQLLVRAITRHNTEVSAAVAGQILPFLSDANVHQFSSTLSKMPPRSEAYKNLKANLEEFRHEQNHG